MPDHDLHPDIIRAMDVYDKAKPFVMQLRAEIDKHTAKNTYVPASIVVAAGRLEKLFEEENEDG